jgi:membrane associated rhomboid family serine protease
VSLAPDGRYGVACGRCGGFLVADEQLELRHPRATALLEVETDERAPAFAAGYECPGCRHMLAPWKIAGSGVHAFRCTGCAWSFLPRTALGVLVQRVQKRAAVDAYNSLPEAERKEIARDLASPAAGSESLSPGHAFLALLGFPVVSNIERRRAPVATFSLAAVLVLAFFAQLWAGIDSSTAEYGYYSSDPSIWAAIRSVFLHAGWWHLIGNVYFLIAFGDGVEQRVSRPTLIGFFVGAGALTLMLDGLLASHPTLIVGASGGVAVLIGACIILQPQARVVTSVMSYAFKTSMVFYGVIELGYQAVMSLLGVRGVAWVAHLTGLAIGLALGMAVRFSRPRK